MKKVKSVLLMAAWVVIVSCNKGSVDNCQTCSGEGLNTIELCEENGELFLEGERIPDSDGISLDRFIRELKNEDGLENLTCN